MTRDDINKLGIALLDTVEPDGIPEGHVYAAATQVLRLPFGAVHAILDLFIGHGLLTRDAHHYLYPGPRWADMQEELAAYRHTHRQPEATT